MICYRDRCGDRATDRVVLRFTSRQGTRYEHVTYLCAPHADEHPRVVSREPHRPRVLLEVK